MTGLTVLASGKGGVGKTFLAVSLAHALTHLGRRVLLVDADLGLANIDVQLGFDEPIGLGRAIAGGLDPGALVQDRGGGLSTLTGAGTGQSLDGLATARLEEAVERLAALATSFDEVLVDLPSGLDRVGPAFIGKARRLLLVGSNEPTSLTDNYALVKLTRGAAPRPLFVANAVADALNVRDVPLPITPNRLNAIVAGAEPAPPPDLKAAAPAAAEVPADKDAITGAITGDGEVVVKADPAAIWDALLDPQSLKAIIPGCHAVEAVSENHYRAEVSLGVGPIRGRFTADVHLSDLVEHRAAKLSGTLSGPLGKAEGRGRVTLAGEGDSTRIGYTYGVDVGGKVASVGGRMIRRAAQLIIGEFFERLGRVATGGENGKAAAAADAAQPAAPAGTASDEAAADATPKTPPRETAPEAPSTGASSWLKRLFGDKS